MVPLIFADIHNMITFLTKSDASKGFDQIVDFLNAHTIQYALVVNPTIYVSCIKQFWAFVSIKKSNDAVKLEALIDSKKVIITDDTIRQNLRLDDADVIDYLPNEEIFDELARMGYEKPTKYTSLALTQKVFANMRRIGMKIVKLKKRVRKLEKKRKFNSSSLKRLKKDTDQAKPSKVKEVLKVVTAAKLMIEVVTTAAPISIVAQVTKASAPRRRRGVVIQDPEEIAAALVIVHTKRREKHDNTVMRYQALKRKSVTEAQERKNMMIYLKNMAVFKMDFLKGMTFSDIRPIFEKHYNSIQAFLEKEEKEIKEEGSKRKGFTLEQMLNNVRLKVEEDSEMSLELLTLELMLFKTLRKCTKGLLLLVEELVLLVHIDSVRRNDDVADEIKKLP
uniref:Xylulose kinase-1 n=1 Tax=Tanacetum cinerariifolium TaxID=118510 RepID=A0A6L2NXN3_TANCI|nr:hypothetical protein [Tanacetum cinerariifolium]